MKLFIISFFLLSANLSAESAINLDKSYVAVEEKSAAMKSLKQKFAQEHKSQGHEISHALKKSLPKATSLPKNSH